MQIRRSVLEPVNTQRVLNLLRNPMWLPRYETRIAFIEAVSPDTGDYVVRGRIALLPWHSTLRVRSRHHGMSFRLMTRPYGVGISGSYTVTETHSGALIHHMECWDLPWWWMPLLPILWLYFNGVIGGEMQRLTDLIRSPSPPAVEKRGPDVTGSRAVRGRYHE